MNRSLRGQLGFLALLAMLDGVASAASLPPFRVDPTLLGLPPAPEPSPAVSAPGSSAVTSAMPPNAASAGSSVAMPAAATTDAGGKPQEPKSSGAPSQTSGSSAKGGVPASAAATLPLPSDKAPVFIEADRIDGTTSVETVAQGNVDLKRADRTLKSDRLVYREPIDEAEATGNVKLTGPGEVVTGPHLKLKLGDSIGTFDTPAYSVHRLPAPAKDSGNLLDQYGNAKRKPEVLNASGTAVRLDFEGKDRYRMNDATYSTCPASKTGPDWFVRVTDLSLDYTQSLAVAKGATVYFMDTPILYSPWMSFTLDKQRKTGLLAPTIGSTSKSGIETTLPFYWNIAPDMDATIAPRFMAKRGVQWGGEYRYLAGNYSGQVSGEFLPDDNLTHTNRSALTLEHHQDFGGGLTGSLNLNRVSDDTYFTDLSTRLSNITQTNLLRQGILSYGAGWWSASLMAQRYQTLQDPLLPPIAHPYDRLPQLLVSADRADFPFGTEMMFSGEYVKFSNPFGSQVEGTRTTLYPQLSLPMQTASSYVTPKIGFHSTRYQLDQQAVGVPDQITRNVPIFSIDSGVTFERPLDWFGQSLTQTLEPRAYYLRVPHKDQSLIPVFDTGLADFNFAQIFSENSFSGGDRIADANQLTVAVTSRLIDTENGEELIRGAIGQRYYFADQTVILPGGTPRTNRLADFLGAISGKVTKDISLDSGVEYNYHDQILQRFNIMARYQPEPGKVFNAGYRYTDALLKQIDASAQWPLFGGWHGVARYNYSLRDKRVIESIAGLEYDGGCWVSRFVVQRVASAVGQSNNSIFVQLELNGFSDIGSNPLAILRRDIRGYGQITQPTADPIFAGQ
jgi:LPS-assembly protein